MNIDGQIIDHLSAGPMTKRQLAKELNCDSKCVTSAVARLVDIGEVQDLGTACESRRDERLYGRVIDIDAIVRLALRNQPDLATVWRAV